MLIQSDQYFEAIIFPFVGQKWLTLQQFTQTLFTLVALDVDGLKKSCSVKKVTIWERQGAMLK